MLKEINDVTKVHIMQCLTTCEVNYDSVRRSKYAEFQQHSIKNSAADTAAMNISNTVDHALIDL